MNIKDFMGGGREDLTKVRLPVLAEALNSGYTHMVTCIKYVKNYLALSKDPNYSFLIFSGS